MFKQDLLTKRMISLGGEIDVLTLINALYVYLLINPKKYLLFSLVRVQ